MLVDGFQDSFIAVPDTDGKDTAKKIQVFASLRIIDDGVFGTVNDERLLVIVGNAGEKVLLVFPQYLGCFD